MNINEQLKLLNNEDIVWIIYLLIIVLALYTNKLERENIFNNNKIKKINASKINTLILIIALGIYLYLTSISIKNFKYVKNNIQRRIAIERLIVSLTFLCGGILALYADFDNNTNNLDIAIT